MMKLHCFKTLLLQISSFALSSFTSGDSSSVKKTDKLYISTSKDEEKRGTPRIVGGHDVSAGSYPWYSALYKPIPEGGFYFYCGGQLVDKEFILTAAHCKPEKDDLVFVGALCPTEEGNCGQYGIAPRVRNVFEDPRFKHEITHTLGYDYALIQLDSEVTSISPVKLDDGTFSPNYQIGKNLWAIGLGLVSVEPEEEIATQLQHIILSYVPEKECREEVKPYNLGKSTICARHDLGAGDACRGDSGGPLFDEDNQVIVGLTSYGDARCDSRNPGVYAKVSDNWPWIKDTICDNSSGPKSDICAESPKPFTDNPSTQWCRDGADVDILLATDQWPQDTVWFLADLHSNVVVSGGDMCGFETDASHEGNFCLPVDNDQCYSFVVYDKNGDGIDIGGGDPDYCISVNGEEVECEINFTGNMETVVFPADSCSKSCKPLTYRLKGRTPVFPIKTVMSIQDLDENLVTNNLYDLSELRDKGFDFHIDLCTGCYSFVVHGKDGTSFTLYDEKENRVFTQNDFDWGSTVDFCVYESEAISSSPTASPPRNDNLDSNRSDNKSDDCSAASFFLKRSTFLLFVTFFASTMLNFGL